MKNITFSADEGAIEAARKRARDEGTTLNEAFRRWIEEYGRRPRHAEDVLAVLDRLRYVDTGGRKFSRGEMNERPGRLGHEEHHV